MTTPGQLGVVREGAIADLLLVVGDPLADLALLADPDTNMAVIMKDGTVVDRRRAATRTAARATT